MKKYVKTFVVAFMGCELVELLYNYFYEESIQQMIFGFISSVIIAVCISFGLNNAKWDKIKEKINGETK